MCSMWEKRGERGPERMKLKTNIGQLQRRVPVVCEAEKQFVASDRLLERWQLNSFIQMMPAAWRSVLSKSAAVASRGGEPSPAQLVSGHLPNPGNNQPQIPFSCLRAVFSCACSSVLTWRGEQG